MLQKRTLPSRGNMQCCCTTYKIKDEGTRRTKFNSVYIGTSVGISKTITTISSLGYRHVRRAGFLGLCSDLSILSQDSSW
jgi:hypothetical protein